MKVLPVTIINRRDIIGTKKEFGSHMHNNAPVTEFQNMSINHANGIYFNPSFGRTAENAELMRKLFKYGMIDIHTGKPVIDPDLFQEWLQKNIFSRSLRSVVNIIKPYENCLHEVQGLVFNKIKSYAEKHPLYRLNDAINSFAPNAQQELINLQNPIFDRLNELAKSLPSEQKAAFKELMNKKDQQLENQPIPYKFSKKEFRYKLNRIAQEIKQRGINEEIRVVEKLTNMSSNLPYMPSGRNFVRRTPKVDVNKSMTQAGIIKQMENHLSRSVLSKDKELVELIESAKNQIFNIKTIIPFKRKSFIHELESIVNTISDQKLAHKLITEARKLPTAQQEVSAFITKSYRNSSEKIGYDLLIGSVGAIDHITVKSKNGIDALENYAYTSIGSNSKRGNMHMTQWMRKNPATYEGSQKCVDKLIELKNNGILNKEGLSPWYIYTFAEKMEKLAPGEKPLKIDLSGLQ